jgi:hypothetical protein
MGLILHWVYNFFKFVAMPLFFLMIIGKPRFLINFVHKLLDIKEPISKVKVFRFILLLNTCICIYSFYRKWELTNLVNEMHLKYNKDPSAANMHFMDEKTREANMFERNCYMFFTIIVIIVILEKFCHSYFSLWKTEGKIDFLTTHSYTEVEKNELEEQSRDEEALPEYKKAQTTLGPNTPQELPLSQKDKEYLKKTQ